MKNNDGRNKMLAPNAPVSEIIAFINIIRESTSRGNDVEIREKEGGMLAIYEVRKKLKTS